MDTVCPICERAVTPEQACCEVCGYNGLNRTYLAVTEAEKRAYHKAIQTKRAAWQARNPVYKENTPVPPVHKQAAESLEQFQQRLEGTKLHPVPAARIKILHQRYHAGSGRLPLETAWRDWIRPLLSNAQASLYLQVKSQENINDGVLYAQLNLLDGKAAISKLELFQNHGPLPVFGLNDPNVSGHCFRDTLQQGLPGPLLSIVPAGSFQMGDIQGKGDANEKPVHEVTLEEFALGVYPVTVAEYEYYCIMESIEHPETNNAPEPGQLPVVNISLHDALAYCRWLSHQTGQRYRLPTEAEWEYAARAGSDTEYCFGDKAAELRDYGWYTDNARKRIQSVGLKKPNAWGLHDMHGNVWEWTCSRYTERYDGAELCCVDKSMTCVIRGGSYQNSPRHARSAYRDGWEAHASAPVTGFRVVRIL
jgi:formylglycine-generating enzyme required for sulfatase activity